MPGSRFFAYDVFYLFLSRFTSAEVVEHYVVWRYSQRIQQSYNRFAHWAGAAHVVFYIFWFGMILQVLFVHYLMYEPRCVFNVSCVGFRVRTVESQVEFEVGEVLFKLKEVVQIEYFGKRTCSVEI